MVTVDSRDVGRCGGDLGCCLDSGIGDGVVSRGCMVHVVMTLMNSLKSFQHFISNHWNQFPSPIFSSRLKFIWSF